LLKFKLNLNYTLTLKVRPSSNLKDIGTQIDNTIKFDVNLSLTVTPLEVQRFNLINNFWLIILIVIDIAIVLVLVLSLMLILILILIPITGNQVEV